jgi:hypothetical protein
MDRREARSILSLHRANEPVNDERFAQAKELAAKDSELARWWVADQEVDDAIATQLAAVPVPADLKARVISRAKPAATPQFPWRRPALHAAAAIVVLAVLFGLWERPFKPAASLADYRAEMVRFFSVWQPLDLETNNLTDINKFLAKSGAPSGFDIPQPLRDLEPVGCTKLQFRGEDVAVICFKRGNGKIAHLFVINRKAIQCVGLSPNFANQGNWATAAWVKGDFDYLLTVQGDQHEAAKLIGNT